MKKGRVNRIHNADFVAWAADEDYRITFEGAPKYHAILCDPPYGISFMGKKWDAGGPEAFQATAKSWGEAIKPLLCPGALVFMFAGTRMWHRLAAGMEDAGFHLWDTLMWLHGQGFPKGQDISKLIDRAHGNEREKLRQEKRTGKDLGTFGSYAGNNWVSAPGSEISVPWAGHKTPQLKPAWEPVLAFRAPSQGKKYVELALEHGSGTLNVDSARIEYQSEADKASATPQGECTAKPGALAGGTQHDGKRSTFERPELLGRYPANLVLDEEAAATLDSQSGRDTGGASRFFYCAKASRSERETGLEEFEPHTVRTGCAGDMPIDDRGKDRDRFSKQAKNIHPTVKPISLNRWLAALLLPPDSVKRRRILVPFAGVGSEMIGCIQAGWDEVVGVEMTPEYCKIAEARLACWEMKAA